MVRFTAVGLRYPSPDGQEGPEALADLTFTLPEGSFTGCWGPPAPANPRCCG
ncbi:hypothetical protein [Teichococcus aestuarii]